MLMTLSCICGDVGRTGLELCIADVSRWMAANRLINRVAVDMKFHIHIHIHIHRFSVDIHGYPYPWISISTDISAHQKWRKFTLCLNRNSFNAYIFFVSVQLAFFSRNQLWTNSFDTSTKSAISLKNWIPYVYLRVYVCHWTKNM